MEQLNQSKLKTLDLATLEDHFYNNLEEADTLIDYFCVVGLDQLKVQQIAGNRFGREDTLNELRSLKP